MPGRNTVTVTVTVDSDAVVSTMRIRLGVFNFEVQSHESDPEAA
jgi:hypothetical protein